MGDDFEDSIAMWISVEYGKLNINIRLLDFSLNYKLEHIDPVWQT
jgi:hypothetical protein